MDLAYPMKDDFSVQVWRGSKPPKPIVRQRMNYEILCLSICHPSLEPSPSTTVNFVELAHGMGEGSVDGGLGRVVCTP